MYICVHTHVNVHLNDLRVHVYTRTYMCTVHVHPQGLSAKNELCREASLHTHVHVHMCKQYIILIKV